MNPAESEYIRLCKQLIEEKFHFDTSEGALRQRDLEYVADLIEEKSGIKLSLSTLKRFWKKDYRQTPHVSTLGALVSLLGYKDWHEFKSKHPLPALPAANPVVNHRPAFNLKVALPIVIAGIIIVWLIAFRTRQPVTSKPVISGPVIFTGNKTVAQGVPSTIIFNYDVSHVTADSFFFQQSWNELEKVPIRPGAGVYSNIYYYPGFHKAKLIANDSIISRFRAHITTDGWLPLVSYAFPENVPVYPDRSRAFRNGALHVTHDNLMAAGVNFGKEHMLSYYNVREFDNTNSNYFSIDTKIRCDSSTRVPCPGFELRIICEEHIFFVRLMGRGCEKNIAIKMGEVIHDGTGHDLSAFGTDLHQWQQLQVKVVNKHATIYLNEKPVYTITFKKDFGRVVGLAYNFSGTGVVDYVRLRNGEDKMVLEDEF